VDKLFLGDWFWAKLVPYVGHVMGKELTSNYSWWSITFTYFGREEGIESGF